jgi:hypothetical protein
MKLMKKKTRKLIDKTVRKALKKNGPALVAGLAGAFASSLATLANTQAPGKRGKSNLADVVDRVQNTLTAPHGKKTRSQSEKKSRRQEAELAH